MSTSSSEHPLFPVAVLVFVLRDGKLLLGKRKGYNEGAWGVPGGHLEHGEGFEEAARRELLEETGLTAETLVFQNVVNRCSGDEQYLHVSFLADGVVGEPVLTEPDKCSGWGWFPLDALPEPFFEWNKIPFEAQKDGRVFVDDVR